jgi:hypothetical protein
MASYIRGIGIYLAILSFAPQPTLARSYSQYATFFPGWDDLIRSILDNDCASEMDEYLTSQDSNNYISYDILGCIIGATPEFRKAEIAAAGLLLGLIPVLLKDLSFQTAQLGMLSIRRPVLAIFISLGAPILIGSHGPQYEEVFEEKPFELSVEPCQLWKRLKRLFRKNQDKSKQRESKQGGPAQGGPEQGGPKQGDPEQGDPEQGDPEPGMTKWFLSAFEYLVIAACVVNNAQLVYQVSWWAVTSFAPHITYLYIVWYCAATLVAGTAFITIRLRVSVKKEGQPSWLARELTPCVYGVLPELRWQPLKWEFVIFSWFTYVGAMVHLILGVLLLGSAVLISLADSAGVLARFVASTIACRVVVQYELHGWRENNKQAILTVKDKTSKQSLLVEDPAQRRPSKP